MDQTRRVYRDDNPSDIAAGLSANNTGLAANSALLFQYIESGIAPPDRETWPVHTRDLYADLCAAYDRCLVAEKINDETDILSERAPAPPISETTAPRGEYLAAHNAHSIPEFLNTGAWSLPPAKDPIELAALLAGVEPLAIPNVQRGREGCNPCKEWMDVRITGTLESDVASDFLCVPHMGKWSDFPADDYGKTQAAFGSSLDAPVWGRILLDILRTDAIFDSPNHSAVSMAHKFVDAVLAQVMVGILHSIKDTPQRGSSAGIADMSEESRDRFLEAVGPHPETDARAVFFDSVRLYSTAKHDVDANGIDATIEYMRAVQLMPDKTIVSPGRGKTALIEFFMRSRQVRSDAAHDPDNVSAYRWVTATHAVNVATHLHILGSIVLALDGLDVVPGINSFVPGIVLPDSEKNTAGALRYLFGRSHVKVSEGKTTGPLQYTRVVDSLIKTMRSEPKPGLWALANALARLDGVFRTYVADFAPGALIDPGKPAGPARPFDFSESGQRDAAEYAIEKQKSALEAHYQWFEQAHGKPPTVGAPRDLSKTGGTMVALEAAPSDLTGPAAREWYTESELIAVVEDLKFGVVPDMSYTLSQGFVDFIIPYIELISAVARAAEREAAANPENHRFFQYLSLEEIMRNHRVSENVRFRVRTLRIDEVVYAPRNMHREAEMVNVVLGELRRSNALPSVRTPVHLLRRAAATLSGTPAEPYEAPFLIQRPPTAAECSIAPVSFEPGVAAAFGTFAESPRDRKDFYKRFCHRAAAALASGGDMASANGAAFFHDVETLRRALIPPPSTRAARPHPILRLDVKMSTSAVENVLTFPDLIRDSSDAAGDYLRRMQHLARAVQRFMFGSTEDDILDEYSSAEYARMESYFEDSIDFLADFDLDDISKTRSAVLRDAAGQHTAPEYIALRNLSIDFEVPHDEGLRVFVGLLPPDSGLETGEIGCSPLQFEVFSRALYPDLVNILNGHGGTPEAYASARETILADVAEENRGDFKSGVLIDYLESLESQDDVKQLARDLHDIRCFAGEHVTRTEDLKDAWRLRQEIEDTGAAKHDYVPTAALAREVLGCGPTIYSEDREPTLETLLLWCTMRAVTVFAQANDRSTILETVKGMHKPGAAGTITDAAIHVAEHVLTRVDALLPRDVDPYTLSDFVELVQTRYSFFVDTRFGSESEAEAAILVQLGILPWASVSHMAHAMGEPGADLRTPTGRRRVYLAARAAATVMGRRLRENIPGVVDDAAFAWIPEGKKLTLRGMYHRAAVHYTCSTQHIADVVRENMPGMLNRALNRERYTSLIHEIPEIPRPRRCVDARVSRARQKMLDEDTISTVKLYAPDLGYIIPHGLPADVALEPERCGDGLAMRLYLMCRAGTLSAYLDQLRKPTVLPQLTDPHTGKRVPAADPALSRPLSWVNVFKRKLFFIIEDMQRRAARKPVHPALGDALLALFVYSDAFIRGDSDSYCDMETSRRFLFGRFNARVYLDPNNKTRRPFVADMVCTGFSPAIRAEKPQILDEFFAPFMSGSSPSVSDSYGIYLGFTGFIDGWRQFSQLAALARFVIPQKIGAAADYERVSAENVAMRLLFVEPLLTFGRSGGPTTYRAVQAAASSRVFLRAVEAAIKKWYAAFTKHATTRGVSKYGGLLRGDGGENLNPKFDAEIHLTLFNFPSRERPVIPEEEFEHKEIATCVEAVKHMYVFLLFVDAELHRHMDPDDALNPPVLEEYVAAVADHYNNLPEELARDPPTTRGSTYASLVLHTMIFDAWKVTNARAFDPPAQNRAFLADAPIRIATHRWERVGAHGNTVVHEVQTAHHTDTIRLTDATRPLREVIGEPPPGPSSSGTDPYAHARYDARAWEKFWEMHNTPLAYFAVPCDYAREPNPPDADPFALTDFGLWFVHYDRSFLHNFTAGTDFEIREVAALDPVLDVRSTMAVAGAGLREWTGATPGAFYIYAPAFPDSGNVFMRDDYRSAYLGRSLNKFRRAKLTEFTLASKNPIRATDDADGWCVRMFALQGFSVFRPLGRGKSALWSGNKALIYAVANVWSQDEFEVVFGKADPGREMARCYESFTKTPESMDVEDIIKLVFFVSQNAGSITVVHAHEDCGDKTLYTRTFHREDYADLCRSLRGAKEPPRAYIFVRDPSRWMMMVQTALPFQRKML